MSAAAAPSELHIPCRKPAKGIDYARLNARELLAVFSQWTRYSTLYRNSQLDAEELRDYLACLRVTLARLEGGCGVSVTTRR